MISTEISKFDRETTIGFRENLQKALDDLQAKFGVKIHVGNATMAANMESVDFKVTCTVEGGKSIRQQRHEARHEAKKETTAAFLHVYGQFDAPEIDLDAPFKHPDFDGKIKLTGYNKRAPKMPFEGVVIDGTQKGRQLKFGAGLVTKYGVKKAK